MKQYQASLFIFRRDLRLNDNTGLLEALRLSERVIPCFILDPRQVDPHPYQSKPGLRFMLESIHDLQCQLQSVGGELALYHAPPEEIVERLVLTKNVQAVFINRDYTPFSRQRDHSLALLCERLGVALCVMPDALLNEPEHAIKADRTPYRIFTAFYNNARRLPVALPQAASDYSFLTMDDGDAIDKTEAPPIEAGIRGGRSEALRILDGLDDCADYQNSRDFPMLDATSKLSTHLKFGTCSIREAFYAITRQLGSEHPLIRQLYWRDFFTHVAYHFPYVFERPFLEKLVKLRWENKSDHFEAWCLGKTGFPIVDAGMRELNTTGYMHNRVRMITASFLVKDLHVDWRWGERYFAQHLIDYDPCVNNGNWQWAASTGCDAQPYFRIFNPWLQQLKFDRDCRYIYRWLPELRGFSPAIIHGWNKKHFVCDYPAPIVDHARESKVAKDSYKILALSQG